MASCGYMFQYVICFIRMLAGKWVYCLFQAEDGIRDPLVAGVQTCALPISTPWGAASVVSQLRIGLADRGFPSVGIDWHGHNDRGLATANALAAAAAGADRLHGTALGIGERTGNASTEQLMTNLCDIGWRTNDLTMLPQYCQFAAQACGIVMAGNQPIVGSDAFRTATGVHAAAIRKAERLGGRWVAERVYAGIPASAVGREQLIEVGSRSGRANIMNWLDTHGIAAHQPLVREMQDAVAGTDHVLTDQQLRAIVDDAASVAKAS